MSGDFLSGRLRLAASRIMVIEPLLWDGMPGRTCWHHVKQLIADRGGSFAYGWALGTPGPIDRSPRFVVPLYNRWVNHVLWSDPAGQLWEVTPVRDELSAKMMWEPTHFILDNEAQFEVASEEVCCPQPAVYVAIRPEGELAADCLSEAERAPREMQDHWVNKALDAVRQAGYVPTTWRVKRVGDKLRDVLIVASSG